MLTILFWYSLFGLAFVTLFLTLDPLLDRIEGFDELCLSWADFLVPDGYGLLYAPLVRSIIVTILTLGILRVLRLILSLLWRMAGNVMCKRVRRGARVRFASNARPSDGYLMLQTGSNQTLHVHEGGVRIGDLGDLEERDEGETNANSLSTRDENIHRLLGREGFHAVMRRILESVGRFPPLESFPILDANGLRPYNRFSDPELYDNNLYSLVRPNYVGSRHRVLGSEAFFAEIDRLVATLDERDVDTPLPIALQRHPNLVHSHPFMEHRRGLRDMTDVVFSYQDTMRRVSLVHNALHREFRILITCLLYLIGRLDQAVSYGDLVNCMRSLDLIDNITTSLRGLMEIEYTLREEVYKNGY